MPTVKLTVLQFEGKWTVRLDDGRCVQYLGATDSRSNIEAFAAKLMADLVAAGDQVELKVEATIGARVGKRMAVDLMFPRERSAVTH